MFGQMFSDIDKTAAVLQWGVVIGASLAAAISDLRTRRIPNRLTFPVLLTGLVWAVWTNGMTGLAEAAGACFVVSLPFVLLFLFGNGGAGDAKLMGAIGAWLGWSQGITVLFCVVIAGIVLSVIKAATRGRLKSVLRNVFISVYNFILFILFHRANHNVIGQGNIIVEPSGLVIPYGTAIFAGVCAAGGMALL